MSQVVSPHHSNYPMFHFVFGRMLIKRGLAGRRALLDTFDPELPRRLRSVSGLPVVHTDSYVCGLPAGHRFQMGKFRAAFRSLVADGVVDPRKQVGHSSSSVHHFFFTRLREKRKSLRADFSKTESDICEGGFYGGCLDENLYHTSASKIEASNCENAARVLNYWENFIHWLLFFGFFSA